ncbi:hypothetical protein [Marinomonas posidonica]|uniref:Porin domain-containing protein n=1 Tax=Marinomonas posidonica (strain CECT 7376 / NCIMB 14433 / IVIA-Po-181) TaxID=491952 RepID=F6CTH7_MARPP|nr:hypothetical protein [Marinomonas posidonica]AEF54026.1 hypothetical protein Mar181_0977 [Marinomonas posidonica IVIA-Po-181]
MKAIKLASVFAVSAVAAAVSTTTIAAEAVFSGEAGIEYTSYSNDGNGDLVDGTDIGEVELSVDTGVVYAEIEIATSGEDEGTTVGMEKLYVKQGAVSFGRFDGSVSTGSFMGMDEIYSGVDLNTGQGTKGDTDNTGVRYTVTPELTVALEATEASGSEDSQVGFALSYVQDFGGFKAGLSGGSIDDANAVNVGVQTTAGPATLSLNYGVGETGTGTTTDVEQMTASVAIAATEALTLTVEYSQDLESANEPDGTYFVGEYAAGDLTYYVKNYSGDLVGDTDERTIVGVSATF